MKRYTDSTIGQRKAREPKNVEVCIEFVRIGEIDTLNERYSAEINIEARWIDMDLPVTVNNTYAAYNPKIHWNPKLYIENIIQEPKENITYEVLRRVDGGSLVVEKRQLKGFFWERLELQKFPFDIQELGVTLISKLDKTEICLVSNPKNPSHINLSGANVFSDQQKWTLYKFVKVRESASYDFDSKSVAKSTIITDTDIHTESFETIVHKINEDHKKLVGTIYCSRRPGYYMWNAFSLIFLITISAICIFSVDPKLPQSRLQISFTLLLTSVSLKWITNRYLPTISYLTSLDWYSIVCIFYLCLLCIWHSVVGSFWTEKVARVYDQWVMITFVVVFLLFHIIAGFWIISFQNKLAKLKRQEDAFLTELKRISYSNSNINIIR